MEHRLQERLAPETHVEVEDRNVQEPGEIQHAIPEARHVPPPHTSQEQRENAEVDEENRELEGVREEERNRGQKREASEREEALPEERDFGGSPGLRAHAARSGPRPAL